ncbi:DUF4197 domain-containing protein [Ideonella sp. BN130291]|uniref:DUF4197 domain-containing protein n=1 Tax=Ideonella sp. BN130291 TaxID=3112940 RepID=UPI002E257260|nr:DUF4197 domain-containing protein [Ideonella sp. BN130291]
MQRRHWVISVLVTAATPWQARAASETDAASAIRVALQRGAAAAVAQLGRNDGFLANPKVRIPLPGPLKDAAKLLQALGQQHRVDELVVAMNRAAEAAVPQAKALLIDAVRSMSVEDGLRIVSGGDDAATQFFAGKTREPLGERFLPIVTRATHRVALAEKYNAVAGKAAAFGLMKAEDADLPRYVTGRALDGLYQVIGEQERLIRQDPVGTGSAILRRVFGG